jgi:hypothetical protein
MDENGHSDSRVTRTLEWSFLGKNHVTEAVFGQNRCENGDRLALGNNGLSNSRATPGPQNGRFWAKTVRKLISHVS